MLPSTVAEMTAKLTPKLYSSSPVHYFISLGHFTDYPELLSKPEMGINASPMSVTVSRLCVCDSSPSSFSDSESCRDNLVLLRLPALRIDDREPPFFTRKLRAPLI